MDADSLLKYEDVAARLGISVRIVRRMRAQGFLRAVQFGHRTVRFRPADVEQSIARLAGEKRQR